MLFSEEQKNITNIRTIYKKNLENIWNNLKKDLEKWLKDKYILDVKLNKKKFKESQTAEKKMKQQEMEYLKSLLKNL